MRTLSLVLFGVFVGLVAAGIVLLFDVAPTTLFGIGMLYGAFAQLVAHRLFADGRDRDAHRGGDERAGRTAERLPVFEQVPPPREALDPNAASLTAGVASRAAG
jgi:hypothetical protein